MSGIKPQNHLTRSALIAAMYPDCPEEELPRLKNLVSNLMQKNAFVSDEAPAGTGNHRTYDPLWIILGRVLVTFKENYRLSYDVLADIGAFLWANRDMVEGCPQPVVAYGEFWNDEEKDWHIGMQVISSETESAFFFVNGDGREIMRHGIFVAIHQM